VIEDSVPVLVNASVYDVCLLCRRLLGKHHRPQAKPGETLDESQHGPLWLGLDRRVVASRCPPSEHHGHQADDDGCLNLTLCHRSTLQIE
jgi:hypothetical protein